MRTRSVEYYRLLPRIALGDSAAYQGFCTLHKQLDAQLERCLRVEKDIHEVEKIAQAHVSMSHALVNHLAKQEDLRTCEKTALLDAASTFVCMSQYVRPKKFFERLLIAAAHRHLPAMQALLHIHASYIRFSQSWKEEQPFLLEPQRRAEWRTIIIASNPVLNSDHYTILGLLEYCEGKYANAATNFQLSITGGDELAMYWMSVIHSVQYTSATSEKSKRKRSALMNEQNNAALELLKNLSTRENASFQAELARLYHDDRVTEARPHNQFYSIAATYRWRALTLGDYRASEQLAIIYKYHHTGEGLTELEGLYVARMLLKNNNTMRFFTTQIEDEILKLEKQKDKMVDHHAQAKSSDREGMSQQSGPVESTHTVMQREMARQAVAIHSPELSSDEEEDSEENDSNDKNDVSHSSSAASGLRESHKRARVEDSSHDVPGSQRRLSW